MSVTLDANILVYASNEADEVHRPAYELVESLAAGPELVYLFWPTIVGYLRLVTHPAILPRPLRFPDATLNITQFLARPHMRTAGEGSEFWHLFRSTATDHERGNDIPDVHLVALMRQYGVHLIYTRDRGFRRFTDIEVYDPFS